MNCQRLGENSLVFSDIPAVEGAIPAQLTVNLSTEPGWRYVLTEGILPEIVKVLGAKTLYICTNVEKDLEEDQFDGGLIEGEDVPEGFDKKVKVVADSLPQLLVKLGEKFHLNIDKVTIPPAQEELPDDVTEINFHRQEDEDGDPPTAGHTAQWKVGETKQYYATYRFTIERRMVIPITRNEIEAEVEID